jgi:feruloyl esterase
MPRCIANPTIAAVALATVTCLFTFEARAVDSEKRCEALRSVDFSDIQDAPTQVMAAHIVPASGDVPSVCHVQGYVTAQVGFELRLPATDWNGKLVEVGCGGFCGSPRYRWRTSWCDVALSKRYACLLSDQGHTSIAGDADGSSAAGSDAIWAYNNLQAKIDYGFRAAHVTALAGKAISQRFYGVVPKVSYFIGSSGGGRQGLVEAQRFPWDFQGIAVTDPAINLSSLFMTIHWNARAVTSVSGRALFRPDEVELLHSAIIANCDLDDGVRDGVISYPPACRFDPVELLCRKNQKTACLSQEQVTAARKVYSGPMTSIGEKLFSGGAMPGSENGDFWSQPKFASEFFRYMALIPDPGPGWQAADFDFNTDYRRLEMMEAIYASNNPDLRQFLANKGKLIIIQGWDDSGLPPLRTADYYEMVEKAMGGPQATREFARLFMVPGRAHDGRRSGPGANAIDLLQYLDAWVEQGRAPEMIVASRVEGGADLEDLGPYITTPKNPSDVRFTRPIYPYPVRYRYKGSGDPDDYRNFEPVEP